MNKTAIKNFAVMARKKLIEKSKVVKSFNAGRITVKHCVVNLMSENNTLQVFRQITVDSYGLLCSA